MAVFSDNFICEISKLLVSFKGGKGKLQKYNNQKVQKDGNTIAKMYYRNNRERDSTYQIRGVQKDKLNNRKH